jgi:hypothetical protein
MFTKQKFVMSTFGAIAALVFLSSSTTSTLAISGSPWDDLPHGYSTASANDGSPWDGPHDDGSPWDGPDGGSPKTV